MQARPLGSETAAPAPQHRKEKLGKECLDVDHWQSVTGQRRACCVVGPGRSIVTAREWSGLARMDSLNCLWTPILANSWGTVARVDNGERRDSL